MVDIVDSTIQELSIINKFLCRFREEACRQEIIPIGNGFATGDGDEVI
jgi:hypothetical protein